MFAQTAAPFEGDAILAFFGAPERHYDHPELAVRTALEMRDQLGELEHEWRGVLMLLCK